MPGLEDLRQPSAQRSASDSSLLSALNRYRGQRITRVPKVYTIELPKTGNAKLGILLNTTDDGRLLVESVLTDSLAARAAVPRGLIVDCVNGRPVFDKDDVRQVLSPENLKKVRQVTLQGTLPHDPAETAGVDLPPFGRVLSALSEVPPPPESEPLRAAVASPLAAVEDVRPLPVPAVPARPAGVPVPPKSPALPVYATSKSHGTPTPPQLPTASAVAEFSFSSGVETMQFTVDPSGDGVHMYANARLVGRARGFVFDVSRRLLLDDSGRGGPIPDEPRFLRRFDVFCRDNRVPLMVRVGSTVAQYLSPTGRALVRLEPGLGYVRCFIDGAVVCDVFSLHYDMRDATWASQDRQPRPMLPLEDRATVVRRIVDLCDACQVPHDVDVRSVGAGTDVHEIRGAACEDLPRQVEGPPPREARLSTFLPRRMGGDYISTFARSPVHPPHSAAGGGGDVLHELSKLLAPRR